MSGTVQAGLPERQVIASSLRVTHALQMDVAAARHRGAPYASTMKFQVQRIFGASACRIGAHELPDTKWPARPAITVPIDLSEKTFSDPTRLR
jgi:hypothetical protein